VRSRNPCPFCDAGPEKRPIALRDNPPRFKCFSCNKRGPFIELAAKYEGLTVAEYLKRITESVARLKTVDFSVLFPNK
jgi:hypothetical protein